MAHYSCMHFVFVSLHAFEDGHKVPPRLLKEKIHEKKVQTLSWSRH